MKSIGSYIPRRATLLRQNEEPDSRPLTAWRSEPAYVLLAEPGAGKTRAFEVESEATGGAFLKARDFIDLSLRAEWKGKTLFIDGLDEMRAGSTRENPLRAIRRRLDELGRPHFRLSCREADWLGAVDRADLEAIAPTGRVSELRLDALDDDDVVAFLKGRSDLVQDAHAFWREAEQRNLAPLLRNPLLLELMASAVHGGQWPRTRTETYELACEQLATERNQRHRVARRGRNVQLDQLLTDAGLLCAVLLLAGLEGYVYDPSEQSTAFALVESLPPELGVHDVDGTLRSGIFTAEDDRRSPRHRSIAEFLAARAIARRVLNDGLPISRVLALMSALDGGIVEPLRGLHAWLTLHCFSQRSLLIERDPLGVVLYGDVASFAPREKRQILEALYREAERFPWFRSGQWQSHPFGALGTSDMVGDFVDVLGDPKRDLAQQSLLDCALDAIKHGESMPALLPSLDKVFRDPTFQSHVRSGALEAWLEQAKPDVQAARVWLYEIKAGSISDPEDELCGVLLHALYPKLLSAAEVVEHFHPAKADSLYGTYRHFWNDLVKHTAKEQLPALADAWAEVPAPKGDLRADFHWRRVSGQLLTAVLEAFGASESVDRLFRWLGMGLDEHGYPALDESDSKAIKAWLAERPAIQKAILVHGWSQARAAKGGRIPYWHWEQRLYRAQRPEDFPAWMLEQAAAAEEEQLARDCFDYAARVAINPTPGPTLTMEAVEDWVERNVARWPSARAWLTEAWSRPIDASEAEDRRHTREREAQRLADRDARRQAVAPHLDSLRAGAAPPKLMKNAAFAYLERFTDIDGETPVQRVQDFLGGSEEEARSVIAGFERTLQRNDLPKVSDILELDAEDHWHLIRPACLLGADLVSQRDPQAPLRWSDELARELVAFRLTDGTTDTPTWYSTLAAQRPALVASVFEPFVAQRIKRRADSSITELWNLRDEANTELAVLALPGLLNAFPARASRAQLHILNTQLLTAAAKHLSRDEFRALVRRRLKSKTLDAGQRIAWLVCALSLDSDRHARELVGFIGKSQARAAQLGLALEAQAETRHHVPRLPVSALESVVEALAPHSLPDRPTGYGRVSDADRRRDVVHSLLQQLASFPDKEASQALARLRALPSLKRWAPVIDAHRFENTRIARAAAFRHAAPDHVAQTLANRAPANPLDLAALVRDLLRNIEAHFRGDDTNELRLFWRRNTQGETVPELENHCRDVLLAKLRDRLKPLGIDVGKEGTASQNSRSDLKVSFARPGMRFIVPIEIKLESSRELWTAWKHQLDALYAIDPAAGGSGIYIVLWFNWKLTASPSGHRARTPHELLEAIGALIPAEDRHRLSVLVLDLSLPKQR
ncbi:MAG TPA: hypothetical protein VFR86_14075 [Burkholderiaceae bacterium]|nr:hypothetical protein [Burkholderiaceae bacterium]